jgi:hypothetical protein
VNAVASVNAANEASAESVAEGAKARRLAARGVDREASHAGGGLDQDPGEEDRGADHSSWKEARVGSCIESWSRK